MPIGDKRGTANLMTDFEAVSSHRFVAEKPDHRRGCDGPQILDERRMPQMHDRCIRDHDATRQNDEDNENSGEVFRPTIAIVNLNVDCLRAKTKASHRGSPLRASPRL